MTKWHSAQETEECAKRLPDLESLIRLYCLSRFFLAAVYSRDYCAAPALADLIKLSEAGREAISTCFQASSFAAPDVHLAALGYFYHHDILLDWQATDHGAIQTLLADDILSDRIRFPYRYGRLLYDRFNDCRDTGRTDHLPNEEAWALLENTPVGVYQHGHIVSGPLGLFESLVARWIPLSLELPLWHCSDTGCNKLHSVRFMPPKIPVVKAYAKLEDFLQEHSGPPSEWVGTLQRLHRRGQELKSRSYYDLPLVLANCLVGAERTVLLQELLKTSEAPHLRSCIAASRLGKGVSKLPPQDLAAAMTPEEQLQLVLLASDRVIIQTLDRLTADARIRIPLSEVRRSGETPPARSRGLKSELSSLGIRPDHPAPLAYFCSAILKAYGDLGLSNDLKWRLGTDVSQNAELSLTDYVRRHGPADAVEHLILASKPVAEAVCASVDFDLQQFGPRSPLMVSRLLWKCGFEIPRYDELLARLSSRVEQFNEVALRFDPTRGEEDREAARAAGVNLFVSVEEFLDALISFNVWLLSSDHFVATRFVFSLSEARQAVARVLGESLPSDQGELRWHPSGDNALGTQMTYLVEAAKWMKRLLTLDRSQFERPEHEIPHFADDPYRPFPFRHTQLWADADPLELQRHVLLYERVVQMLLQADLAGVRNGLDHKRDEQRSPSADSMLACVSRLRQATDQAESLRFYPKTYWIFENSKTVFGSWECTFKDFRGRAFALHGPPMVSGLLDVRAPRPLVFAPTNLLGIPDSLLAFAESSESEYSRYWAGYPRRRRLPPDNKADHRAPAEFEQNAKASESSADSPASQSEREPIETERSSESRGNT